MTTLQNEPKIYAATYSLETDIVVLFEARSLQEAEKLAGGGYSSPVVDRADDYMRSVREEIWSEDMVLNEVREATDEDLQFVRDGDEEILKLPNSSE